MIKFKTLTVTAHADVKGTTTHAQGIVVLIMVWYGMVWYGMVRDNLGGIAKSYF